MPASTSPALQRVIVLLFVNLGLSVLLTALLFTFRDSVIDYQLAHSAPPPGPARAVLEEVVWLRVGIVLLVPLVYLYLVRRLRQGRRGAYRRVVLISVVGFLATVYTIFQGQDPLWMVAEQGVQAVVMLGLLYAVTRPELRAQFDRAGRAA